MHRAVAVLCLFVPLSDASVNYCGAAMCGTTDAHTFCQFEKGPGPTCTGYVDDRLSGEEKGRLVTRLNRRRNEAALGSLQQLPTASNMLKLRWVEELAREAQLWADQCNPPRDPEEHDECRDLYAITVGQCVASVVGEAPGLRPESMVDMWYLQGRQYKGNIIIKPTNDKKSPMDFAQMLWAESYLVGCARSRFMTEFESRARTVTRLVCNFAPRAPAGPLWSPGAPAAACPPRARPDPDLPGLCSFHHKAVFTYNVTNATVLKEQSLLDTILEIERNGSLDFLGSLDQIYLRKIIVSNMSQQSIETNQHYTTENSGNNKSIFRGYQKVVVNNTDNSKNVIDDVIAKMIEKTATARLTKSKFSTIGRPKSYNIQDLNLSIKDSENKTTQPVEIVKEDETYNDYEFDITIEKNVPDYFMSTTGSNVTISNIQSLETGKSTEIMTTDKISTEIMTPFEIEYTSTKEIVTDTLNSSREDETTTAGVQNDMLRKLLELSEKADQNPSDSETAKELQEALLRMEQALEPPSLKVRRELHSNNNEELQDARQDEQRSPKYVDTTEKTRSQEFKEISTPDSTPILNMITKFAPFIKSYGDMFKRSGAGTVTVNLVLFASCVVSNSL